MDIPYSKFVPPTIANGYVFRATMSQDNTLVGATSKLIVYGPLSRSRWSPVLTQTTTIVLPSLGDSTGN